MRIVVKGGNWVMREETLKSEKRKELGFNMSPCGYNS